MGVRATFCCILPPETKTKVLSEGFWQPVGNHSNSQVDPTSAHVLQLDETVDSNRLSQNVTPLLTDEAEGKQDVTSARQYVDSAPTVLCVYEGWPSLIDQLVGSLATAAEQCQADRKHAVSYCSGVGPRAREQKKEKLYVRQQEDRCPHPRRERRQATDDALRPGNDCRWRRGGPASLHML